MITTGPAPSLPSTLPPVTTPPPTTPATTASTAPPTTEQDPGGALVAEIEDLIEAAEDIRGLGFLVTPEIVVLSREEFDTRVVRLMAQRDDELRDEAMTQLYRLLGMLESGRDLEAIERELQGPPDTAWYDDTTGELLVVDKAPGFGPLERSELVHEIVHALADQHYRWASIRADLLDEGAYDRLRAFDALVEGDATYFQVVYVQQLSDEERREIATAFLEPDPRADDVPAWLLEDLAFPFDAGFEFVADLVAGGGIAAVDRAYLDPPLSTEHVLHPERYRLGELRRPVEPVEVTLDGYTTVPAAGFGEWALRLLLRRATSPGLLTQTADGWGGDSYSLYFTGGGEVVFALAYLGDAGSHTAEVTQAFIDLAEDVLGLGDGSRRGGGQVYSRSNRPWVFLDREGPGLLVVIASAADAGAALADSLAPPA